jgi:hypothetical protein
MLYQVVKSSFSGLVLLSALACEPVNSGAKAWGDDGRGKVDPPAPTPEEAAAKRAGELFLKALQEKNAKGLLESSLVAGAFRYFLPEAFDGTGKEETIAGAAAASEDKRLSRLAAAKFVTAFAADAPGKYLAVFSEAPSIPEQPGTLQALEVAQVSGNYRVVQIGSNAFGDGGGRWVVNQCSAFAAPFKVPSTLSPAPSFEACSGALKTFKQQLTAKDPEALKSLANYIDGQPFVEHRKKFVVNAAGSSYGIGEDKKAFEFGLSEGDTLRYQFLLSMGSYCGCLPSDKPK